MANQQNYPADDRWLSISAAATHLDVTRQTITKWSETYPDRLPRYRPFPDSRAIRYRLSDLDAFMRPDDPAEARGADREVAA